MTRLERLAQQAALDQRRQLGLDRRRTIAEHFSAGSSTHVRVKAQRLVNFCSNNYLGLSQHPKIIAAMVRALGEEGAGSGASALISGYTPVHASAEAAIAKWKGTGGAVLLPSGYQANFAAIQTLAAIGSGGDDGKSSSSEKSTSLRLRFLLDKLSHASLIDAVRASGKPFRTFPHNDLVRLKRLLEEAEPGELQVVVTESIFSMDGDAADLRGLAELKRSHPFVLMLDEAHGSGVYGKNGAGYANECGLSDMVDIFIVTLSKALGLQGGAICASASFCEAVVNFGRAYLFSTSIAPALAAGAEAAIEVMREEPGRQQRVRELARRVRAELSAAGFAIPAGDTPIIPMILGEERRVAAAAKRLRDAGLLVLPVRPPTVPKGTSRLRVTVSSEHTDEEIGRLIAALKSVSQSHG